MRLDRTIFALLIAMSVALLPVAVGAAAPQTSTEMSMSTVMDDCCPDQAKLCDKAMDNCMSMTACALNALSFSVTSFSSLAFPLMTAHAMPPFVSEAVYSRTDGPPLRPPQA